MKNQQNSISDKTIKKLCHTIEPDYSSLEQRIMLHLQKNRLPVNATIEKTPSWGNFVFLRYAIAPAVILIGFTLFMLMKNTTPTPGGQIVAYISSSIEKPLPVGTAFSVGNPIQTMENEKATLMLPDFSLIRLNEQTELEVVDSRHLRLLQGRLFAEINHTQQNDSFIIDTPSGTVQVLGTSFEIDARQPEMEVRVTDGKVLVKTKDQEVTLTKNQTGLVSHSIRKLSMKNPPPSWITALHQIEAQSPIVQSMRKHFPSRSLDLLRQ